MQIVIIDLGLGNLRSVEQALRTVSDTDVQIKVSSNAVELDRADKVVLPGQGAIGSWFAALERHGLRDPLSNALASKPVLGICVGMQAMFAHCEEDGGVDGLGLFDGSVRHFKHFHLPVKSTTKPTIKPATSLSTSLSTSRSTTPPAEAGEKLKIPQMGWNQVKQMQSHPLWHNINDESYFYFVHSYCANLNQQSSSHGSDSVVFGETDYGHKFISAVGRDNVFAVQFHPEKSHRDGLQLLRNFVHWDGKV